MATNPYDQFDAAVNPYDQFDSPRARTAGEEAKRQVGLMGRMAADTVAALPLAALEGGAGVGNLINRAMGGEGRVSFRQMYEEALNRLLPKPETPLEKATNVAGQMVLGSRIPAPTPKGGTAPAAFRTGKELATETMAARVKAAQQAGYVIPPATGNPSAVAKTAEGISGKLSLAQQASAKNMSNTNRLAAKALGLSEDAPLTLAAVRAVRQEAGQPYEAVRGAGMLAMGPRWRAALDQAEATIRGANRSFPGLAKSDASKRIAALRQDFVDSSDAVDAIRVLRDYADEAGAARNFKLARTYRGLATELENRIERHLVANGERGLVASFRKARELIAKTYSVEKAINKGTDSVSAAKLGRQLAHGTPLSGELRQAGEFALAFPKAAREFNESLPGISPLDFYASGGTAALAAMLSGGSPLAAAPLAYPFVRLGTRNALLSAPGQQLAIPAVRQVDPRWVMGLGNPLVGQ